jgi:hypothetical protein
LGIQVHPRVRRAGFDKAQLQVTTAGRQGTELQQAAEQRVKSDLCASQALVGLDVRP